MTHPTLSRTVLAASAALALVSLPGQAQSPAASPQPPAGGKQAMMSAAAELKDAKGQAVGRVELSETPNGVLAAVTLTGAPAGEHAFHIHEIGKCDAPDFKSAGGHFNPAKARHGILDAKGPHAGDLPNVHVPKGGAAELEFFVNGVSLQAGTNSLLDADGSAFVVHAKPDDYRTDPAGDAGDRIACGVIQKK